MTSNLKQHLASYAISLALMGVPVLIYLITQDYSLAVYFLFGEMFAGLLFWLVYLHYAVPLEAELLALQRSHQLQQQDLLRTRQATQSALNSLPHAVALLSPDGKIEFANTPAQTLFALTPGIAVESSPHSWLPPLLHNALDSKLPVSPPQPTVQIFDHGQELFFLPRAIPILTPNDSVAGITLLLIDATQLRQVDEAKSGLLASLSHELKTPLTSIQMSLHLLLDDAPPALSPRQLELLKTALDDADRLHHLIQTILDTGRKTSQ